MTRIWLWLVYKVNQLIGNLFWPGLGKQVTRRYDIAMWFWSRSYGAGQEYFERYERHSRKARGAAA